MAKQRKPDAGNYTKYMILEKDTETNVQGTITKTASEVAELWCSLWPLRGREFYDSKIVQADVTHLARTWWRDDISPTPAMRLVCPDEKCASRPTENRTFEIESVIDVDEEHEEFEFRLIEAV